MDKLRRVLNGDESPDEESGIMSQLNESATLSWSTRLKGFLACFIIGILLSFLGSFALFFAKGINTFAVFYTLGNITSMASTCFLMGPFNQFKKMFAPTRIIATVVVFISLIMTIISAVALHKAILALLFIIIQFLAMTWYSLSYIPYARDAVKKTVMTCVV
ncbi:vesicle transport protein SFT2A [Aethina tumida]|uniref:vesicle transport protein SFT2A n=1 Tax=Aethina tumida TaxID=116153 RepID=UPI00214749FA|nr:vesicle transport protein SFT2A [Aethina tumida]XP_049818248.1 vesicle transport protein SFT2A [Aethina tumida]XP_049818249.1 vesicle transport protein SFT2A [Aethina tumida]